jgi:hypothetical protein
MNVLRRDLYSELQPWDLHKIAPTANVLIGQWWYCLSGLGVIQVQGVCWLKVVHHVLREQGKSANGVQ